WPVLNRTRATFRPAASKEVSISSSGNQVRTRHVLPAHPSCARVAEPGIGPGSAQPPAAQGTDRVACRTDSGLLLPRRRLARGERLVEVLLGHRHDAAGHRLGPGG